MASQMIPGILVHTDLKSWIRFQVNELAYKKNPHTSCWRLQTNSWLMITIICAGNVDSMF